MKDIEWAESIHCAVTVCDAEGTITYMNAKARETYKKRGNLIGKNLFDCHCLTATTNVLPESYAN